MLTSSRIVSEKSDVNQEEERVQNTEKGLLYKKERRRGDAFMVREPAMVRGLRERVL